MLLPLAPFKIHCHHPNVFLKYDFELNGVAQGMDLGCSSSCKSSSMTSSKKAQPQVIAGMTMTVTVPLPSSTEMEV